MKSTKNWSKGFSKNLLLAAMAALVLTFGLVVVGCDDGKGDDDGGDKGKTVTFTMEKVDANSFTVTVAGAKWNDIITAEFITSDDLKADNTADQVRNVFEVVKTSDTVITATRRDTYLSVSISGTIKVVAGFGYTSTDGGDIPYFGGTTTYVDVTPNGGITFP
jgi:hypothetical protein